MQQVINYERFTAKHPIVSQTVVTVGSPGGHSPDGVHLVTEHVTITNGIMRCTCTDRESFTAPCFHMWDVLLDAKDTYPNFAHINDGALGLVLSLPVFRYSDCLGTFWLRKGKHGITEVRTVAVEDLKILRGMTLEAVMKITTSNEVIGYITADQGLSAILYLYADYFKSEAPLVVACPSSMHGVNNKKFLRLTEAGAPQKMGETYTILVTGRCSFCNKQIGDPDDLVPDL